MAAPYSSFLNYFYLAADTILQNFDDFNWRRIFLAP
jgi:hypothetical protein